jgi:hypothetical protein
MTRAGDSVADATSAYALDQQVTRWWGKVRLSAHKRFHDSPDLLEKVERSLPNRVYNGKVRRSQSECQRHREEGYLLTLRRPPKATST